MYIPTNLTKTKSRTKSLKKWDFWSKNWDIPKKIVKITKLRGTLMHKLLYKKSRTEQRQSRTAVNIEPKIGTVPLKAGQLESMEYSIFLLLYTPIDIICITIRTLCPLGPGLPGTPSLPGRPCNYKQCVVCDVNYNNSVYTEGIYYSLQQQKVKSVKRIATITELVVVWSVCITCIYMYSKSKVLVATVTNSCNTLRFCLRCCKEL